MKWRKQIIICSLIFLVSGFQCEAENTEKAIQGDQYRVTWQKRAEETMSAKSVTCATRSEDHCGEKDPYIQYVRIDKFDNRGE